MRKQRSMIGRRVCLSIIAQAALTTGSTIIPATAPTTAPHAIDRTVTAVLEMTDRNIVFNKTEVTAFENALFDVISDPVCTTNNDAQVSSVQIVSQGLSALQTTLIMNININSNSHYLEKDLLDCIRGSKGDIKRKFDQSLGLSISSSTSNGQNQKGRSARTNLFLITIVSGCLIVAIGFSVFGIRHVKKKRRTIRRSVYDDDDDDDDTFGQVNITLDDINESISQSYGADDINKQHNDFESGDIENILSMVMSGDSEKHGSRAGENASSLISYDDSPVKKSQRSLKSQISMATDSTYGLQLYPVDFVAKKHISTIASKDYPRSFRQNRSAHQMHSEGLTFQPVNDSKDKLCAQTSDYMDNLRRLMNESQNCFFGEEETNQNTTSKTDSSQFERKETNHHASSKTDPSQSRGRETRSSMSYSTDATPGQSNFARRMMYVCSRSPTKRRG